MVSEEARTKIKVQLSLLAGPSLEAVNTVVIRKYAARQFYYKDMKKQSFRCFYGDGAFSDQGIIYETLDMSQPEYHVEYLTLS